MHRFFVSPDHIESNTILIQGSDVAHIKNVLRLKPNDKIYVFDGRGFRYHVDLIEIKKKSVTGQIILKEPFDSESPMEISLGQALLKGNKFDQVIRRAVELGTVEIIPLDTERTLIKIPSEEIEKKTQRWQKIAMEVSKQCGRSRVPKIESSILSVGEFCSRVSGWDLKLCLRPETTTCIRDISQGGSQKKVALLIGPEGGLSAEEVTGIKRQGFLSVSLGPRILRAETAPIAAIAVLQSLWGDL